MTNFVQGYFTPKHPEKYIGDATKIVYRSSWELHTNEFLDNNPNILKWSSEEIAIPYIKPTDKKVHRYYPDYYVVYRDRAGQIHEEIVEVKPLSQTKRSRSRNPNTKLYENLTYAVNMAKWAAAVKWCEAMSKRTGRTITFKVKTEASLFS